MSIDNITPEEWNKMGFKTIKDRATNDLDNEPNDHPVFGENIPDNSTKFDTVDDEDNEPNDHPRFWLTEEGSMVYDSVNRPEHYNTGGMECIDAIEGMLNHDEYIGYLRGNSLKYRWRYRYKGKPIEDLRKARWYEERLISYMLEHPSEYLR